MKIRYCEFCHRKITEHDVALGAAGIADRHLVCKPCFERHDFNSSKLIASISASELPAVPTGNGLRKPGSGLRYPPLSHGIWRRGSTSLSSLATRSRRSSRRVRAQVRRNYRRLHKNVILRLQGLLVGIGVTIMALLLMRLS